MQLWHDDGAQRGTNKAGVGGRGGNGYLPPFLPDGGNAGAYLAVQRLSFHLPPVSSNFRKLSRMQSPTTHRDSSFPDFGPFILNISRSATPTEEQSLAVVVLFEAEKVDVTKGLRGSRRASEGLLGT